MTAAEFEEKTYEIAYDVEMGAGGGPLPWGPGQVLEHLLGFDAAARPKASHPLWQVLGTPRPKGLILIPHHWDGLPGRRPAKNELPRDPFSFLVQFKRPELIRSHAGKQWKLWRAPYFRFKVDPRQQKTLKQLEANTAGEVVVRYAAPAFATNQAMDIARLSRNVIGSSGHVSPSALSGHSVWTYVAPGVAGKANPTGREASFDRLSDLFRERDNPTVSPPRPASTELVAIDRLDSHIDRFAHAALYRRPELRRTVQAWARLLAEQGVQPENVSKVSNFAAIQTLASRLGASWWVLDRAALV